MDIMRDIFVKNSYTHHLTILFLLLVLASGRTAFSQNIFVDNQVLEQLGPAPNVASTLLGKFVAKTQPFRSGIDKNSLERNRPKFPMIIDGRFTPPAGQIGEQSTHSRDMSLLLPPRKKIGSRKSQVPPKKRSPVKASRKGSLASAEDRARVLKDKKLPSDAASDLPKTGAFKPMPERQLKSTGIASVSPTELSKTPRARALETMHRLGFTRGSSNLEPGPKVALGKAISEAKLSESSRVQIKAYASAEGTSESPARRLSLTRALAVRAAFISAGVNSSRIEVRALGSNSGDAPPDRVDVLLYQR